MQDHWEKLFRNSINDFPKKSFLKSPKILNGNIKKILDESRNYIKIGISWTSKSLVGSEKSLTLNQLRPILSMKKKFYFINMQYHNSENEIIKFEKDNKKYQN